MATSTSPHASRRILVVDDEEGLRHLLDVILKRLGYQVVLAANGEEGLAALDADPSLRVVLCDVRMPHMDGLAFLDAVSARDVRVIMMSAYGTTESAVEALRRGAYDFITKPFQPDVIRTRLERLASQERLEAENRALRERMSGRDSLGGFVGRSTGAHRVMDLVQRVADTPSTVLLTGESGTGKEVLARALHDGSSRRSRPFVAVNCAAIPESLLESELFGHERGAFTGAHKARTGLFEEAHTGTLFLDEIGDMPPGLQSRLLRVLQDGRVRRVGGNRDQAVDVRLVAATARDIVVGVAEGSFREDLYYRLRVVQIHIPPLRERVDDIPLLTEALVARVARRTGCELPRVPDDVMRALVAHGWPGNVRELENALERAVILAVEGELRVDDLPPEILVARGRSTPLVGVGLDADDLSIKRQCAALERQLIQRALERTGGNRSQAAKLLEISYKALVYKIRDYDLL